MKTFRYSDLWHEIDNIKKDIKIAEKRISLMVIWLIGLSGFGKSTIAKILYEKIKKNILTQYGWMEMK